MGKVLPWPEFESLAAAGFRGWEIGPPQAAPDSEPHDGNGSRRSRILPPARGSTVPWESRVRSPDARRPRPVRIDLRRPPLAPSFVDDLRQWCRDHLRGDCYLGQSDRWAVECHFQFVDDAALFRLFHG
jgi:hypothetical protein